MSVEIEKYKYPNYFTVYDINDNILIGSRIIYRYPDVSLNIAYDTRQSTIIKLVFDFFDGDPEQEQTLVVFRNGVSIKGIFSIRESTGNTWNIGVQVGYYDKDGVIINNYYQSQLITIAKQYYTANEITLFYTPPQFVLMYEDFPERFIGGGTFLTAKYYSAHPTTPIPISLTLNTYSEFQLQYNVFNYLFPTITTKQQFESYLEVINNNGDGSEIIPIKPTDDTSTPGGGDNNNPNYNDFSDTIDFPDLPTGGTALLSGFIHIYRPSNILLNLLASELWSNQFIDEIKKIQNDPLEAIVTLHSVPFNVSIGDTEYCKIGNYTSGVAMPTILAQFYTIDCGSISVSEHWASALDYAPYTQVEIYLPFVGVKPLQVDDIMGKVLNVKYNIDILTGASICMLKCGESVLYTYNTEVAQNIPFSASSHAQLYQSIISASGAVVGMMSGGAGSIVSGLQSAASVAASKHSQVSRGGSLGGTVGVLGDFTPYLIIHRPIQSLAGDFAHKKGYPSNITATLSSLSGYTEVDTIHLEGVPCTDSERNELYNILKEGVIL